jgi:hypothetical protein
MMGNQFGSNKLILAVALALTLGLAPFVPEPHIIGKVKWLLGGAVGMSPMDYFDALLHGLPWVYLAYQLVLLFAKKNKT